MAEDDTTQSEEKTTQEDTNTEVEESTSEEKPLAHKTHTTEQKTTNKFSKLWQACKSKKKLSIPLTIIAVIILILAVPLTRYPLLGTFLKQKFSVSVVDSQTNKPISSAAVVVNGIALNTDNHGQATVKTKVGNAQLTIAKKYYQSYKQRVLVPIMKSKQARQFKLIATGRQVPLFVGNKITNQGLENVTISASGTEVKTEKDGTVALVLPANQKKVNATLSADGYNDAHVSIQVTDQPIDANQFKLTPAGKIYFLSKLSGKIDVVKTDLDGANRQTVLSGTGQEDEGSTVLLASRDWKYLALQARRDSGLPKLYLLETATDKLTTMDEGNVAFTLTGWLGQSFVYRVDRNNVQAWQPHATAIKAYNASNKSLTTIDETDATGDQNNYGQETINWINILGNDEVVYFKAWSASHTNFSSLFPELQGKQNKLIGASASGNFTKKEIKTYSLNTNASTGGYDFSPSSSYSNFLYEPDELYFVIYTDNTVYNSLKDDQVTENDKNAQQFVETGQSYPTFLVSPDNKQTFWSEPRDGKNTLFVGDQNGAHGTQIANLSDLTPYGWYTNDYLLASKNSSELYILNKNGRGPLIKISDYHKPSLSFVGYGGGYGGL